MHQTSRSRAGGFALVSIACVLILGPSSVAQGQDTTKSVMCADKVPAATAALCNAYHGGIASTPKGGGSSSTTEVTQFEFGVKAPLDNNTKASPGKRQHDPLTVSKPEGGASPQLLQSAATNEAVKTVPPGVTPPTVVPCWNGQPPTAKNPCPPRPKKK